MRTPPRCAPCTLKTAGPPTGPRCPTKSSSESPAASSTRSAVSTAWSTTSPRNPPALSSGSSGGLFVRCQHRSPQRRGFNLDSRVPGKHHVAALAKEVLVNRECRRVVANPRRHVSIAGRNAHNPAHKTKTVGGHGGVAGDVVLVQCASRQQCQQDGHNHAGLVLRRDGSLRIE